MILVDFQDHIGISRADAENWQSRLDLSTEYAPTRRGVPRDYTRENVLELAFLAAMISSGCPPRRGVEIVRDILRDSWGPAAYLVFPAGKFDAPLGGSDLQKWMVDHAAAQSPHKTVTTIHLAGINAAVAALFAPEATG